MKTLAHRLLGSSRSAILAALLLHPDESVHGRELARLTGISPGTLHRELQILTESGVLTRRQTGRQVFYAADRSCPIFDELAGLLRKTTGLADVLRDALAPIADRVALAFVYGSMASGNATGHSDVDVMVLGDVGFSDVVRALGSTQATLRREVNPTVMKPAEFARKRRARDGFIASVQREPKIWLIGNDDDLAKLGKNRSA